MAAPRAVINALISLFKSILSSRLRSTFKIFPLNGKTACIFLSRPCFELPPAESPSTINNSDSAGSRDWQSANFPGRVNPSNAPFLKTLSLAALAAFLALSAKITFSKIALASCGYSSKKWENASAKTPSAALRASGLPSFVLVWPSNCGSRIFTDITAVKPSRTSSPERFSSSVFRKLFFLA